MTNRRARSLLAVLMAFAVLVAACGSDSDESRTTTPEPASGTEAQPTTRDDTTEAQEAEPAAAPTDDDAPGAAQTAAGPSAGGDTTETQEPEPAAALTDDDTPGAAQTAAPPDDPDVQPSLGDIAFTLTPITADDTTSRTEEPPEQDSQDVNLSALLDFICSHEIFVMDANGSNLRQATHNTTSISRPVWSPDGTRFLYVDRHWVHARIQRSVDSHVEDVGVELLTGEECESDGVSHSERGLFMVDADTLATHRLTQPNMIVVEDSLSWSPDGSQVSFLAQVSSLADIETAEDLDEYINRGVYVMNTDGSNLRLLVPYFPTDPHPIINLGPTYLEWADSELRWAPDGSAIAFRTKDSSSVDQVFVANTSGTSIRQVTSVTWLNTVVDPIWSHNGLWLAYAIDGDIYIIRSDGTDLRQLTNMEGLVANLRWSADDSEVYFAKTADPLDLYRPWDLLGVAVNGSGVRKLIEAQELIPNFGSLSEKQRLTVALFGHFTWSPDSSRVLYLTFSFGEYDEPILPNVIFMIDPMEPVSHELAHPGDGISNWGAITDWAWSPDSSSVTVTSSMTFTSISDYSSDFDYPSSYSSSGVETFSSIYRVDTSTGEIRRLADFTGFVGGLTWAARIE